MRYAICYVSNANTNLSREEIKRLLEVSKQTNTQKQMTGILLFSEGNFFQVLEGEKEIVLELFEKIKKDPRHSNIFTIFSKEITKKKFEEYQVDFVANKQNTDKIQDYLYHIQSLDESSQKVVKEVLSIFIDSYK